MTSVPRPYGLGFFQLDWNREAEKLEFDRYLSTLNTAELGIKRRGNELGAEFKGLLMRRSIPALHRLADHSEIWCKWFCSGAVIFKDEVVTTKTRWLRKFDTATPIRSEIPLDFMEKPRSGHSLPTQGCNLELTEVRISDKANIWWTLGFEAFGDIETAPLNLSRGILPEVPTLADALSSGIVSSYPEWLLATLGR